MWTLPFSIDKENPLIKQTEKMLMQLKKMSRDDFIKDFSQFMDKDDLSIFLDSTKLMEIARNTDPRALIGLKLEENSFTNKEKELFEKFKIGIAKYVERMFFQFFSRTDLEKIGKYEKAGSELAFYFDGSVEESGQEATRKKTEEKEIDRVKFQKFSQELGINLSYTKLW